MRDIFGHIQCASVQVEIVFLTALRNDIKETLGSPRQYRQRLIIDIISYCFDC